MAPEHARSRVAHNDLNLVAPVLLIAMNGALGARGFGGTKLAPVEPPHRVIEQILAFRTERGGGLMVGPAITGHHLLHGFCLAGQAASAPVV